MQRLRCVAEQRNASPDDAMRVLEAQRERAPIGGADESTRLRRRSHVAVQTEPRLQRREKLRIGERKHELGLRRRCGPYESVTIALRKQRDRAFRRKALESDATMRLARPELAHDGDLIVVV